LPISAAQLINELNFRLLLASSSLKMTEADWKKCVRDTGRETLSCERFNDKLGGCILKECCVSIIARQGNRAFIRIFLIAGSLTVIAEGVMVYGDIETLVMTRSNPKFYARDHPHDLSTILSLASRSSCSHICAHTHTQNRALQVRRLSRSRGLSRSRRENQPHQRTPTNQTENQPHQHTPTTHVKLSAPRPPLCAVVAGSPW